MSNLARPYQKARVTSSTSTTFPTRVPTVTEPTTVAPASATSQEVIDFTQGGNGPVPRAIMVTPFGNSADNDAFDIQVLGWRRVGTDPNLTLWVPVILASFRCTMSTSVGVAGSPVGASDRFTDTITVLSEPVMTALTQPLGTVKVYSPTTNVPGWFLLPIEGVEKIELIFANNVNTPTKNALVSFLYEEDS